jgi:hypothetical protein
MGLKSFLAHPSPIFSIFVSFWEINFIFFSFCSLCCVFNSFYFLFGHEQQGVTVCSYVKLFYTCDFSVSLYIQKIFFIDQLG